VVEVLVEEAEVRAEWEAHVPVPVLAGVVCALAVWGKNGERVR